MERRVDARVVVHGRDVGQVDGQAVAERQHVAAVGLERLGQVGCQTRAEGPGVLEPGLGGAVAGSALLASVSRPHL